MPLEPRFTFFTDASLGRRIVPEALRPAGLDVVAHDDVFRPGTPDEEWLREAGQRGWIVLTKDKRIRYRKLERRALERATVGAIPRIVRFVRKTPRPFIATVTGGGTVKHLT